MALDLAVLEVARDPASVGAQVRVVERLGKFRARADALAAARAYQRRADEHADAAVLYSRLSAPPFRDAQPDLFHVQTTADLWRHSAEQELPPDFKKTLMGSQPQQAPVVYKNVIKLYNNERRPLQEEQTTTVREQWSAQDPEFYEGSSEAEEQRRPSVFVRPAQPAAAPQPAPPQAAQAVPPQVAASQAAPSQVATPAALHRATPPQRVSPPASTSVPQRVSPLQRATPPTVTRQSITMPMQQQHFIFPSHQAFTKSSPPTHTRAATQAPPPPQVAVSTPTHVTRIGPNHFRVSSNPGPVFSEPPRAQLTAQSGPASQPIYLSSSNEHKPAYAGNPLWTYKQQSTENTPQRRVDPRMVYMPSAPIQRGTLAAPIPGFRSQYQVKPRTVPATVPVPANPILGGKAEQSWRRVAGTPLQGSTYPPTKPWQERRMATPKRVAETPVAAVRQRSMLPTESQFFTTPQRQTFSATSTRFQRPEERTTFAPSPAPVIGSSNWTANLIQPHIIRLDGVDDALRNRRRQANAGVYTYEYTNSRRVVA